MSKNLPPLNPATERFLNILKQFEGKQINLRQYALMMGVSRRWIRYMVSELREKGYIRVVPEHMKIYHKKACRYIFLDGIVADKETFIKDDILRDLGII